MGLALILLLVFGGGAIGSVWRYWLSGVVAERFGEVFPVGTLVVNVIGSLLIGLFAGALSHHPKAGIWLQPFLNVGVCGGLTTFSSFSLQTWNLLQSRRWGLALLNIILSTGLCFGCVSLGWWLTGVVGEK
jgi:fluoride exporter